jgi:hypothetical protein
MHDKAFVSDFARALDKRIGIDVLKRRYGLTASILRDLMEQEPFLLAVKAQRDRHADNGNGSPKDAQKKAQEPAQHPDARGRRNSAVVRKAAVGKKRTEPAPGLAQTLMKDQSFIADMCRFAEGIFTEAAVRKRWRLSENDWITLGSDDDLVRAIEDEKIRRIRSGTAKREAAQERIIKAPAILDSIMSDTNANNRHRVDAAKALDALSTPPGQAAAGDSSYFNIIIDLGGDVVERYSKPRKVGIEADASDNNHVDAAMLAAIATSKTTDGNNGGNTL